MKNLRVLPLLASLWLLASPFASAAPVSAESGYKLDRLRVLQDSVQDRSAAAYRAISDPNTSITTRDLAAAAQAYIVFQKDYEKAEAILRFIFRQQNMDAGSAGFGTFQWQVNHPEIRDENATDFTMLCVGAALVHAPASLSEDFKRAARPHLLAALDALRKRQVTVGYSNIYLMNVSAILLLGEFTGEETAIDEASDRLDRWIAHTSVNGVNEYDSPCYSPVQIQSLETAYNYSRVERFRPRLKRCLDFLWSGMCANYFAGSGTLSGPASRNYDFLFGDILVSQYYYCLGLRESFPGFAGFCDDVRLLTNVARPGAYRPGPEIISLALTPSRAIRSRFGAEPGSDRYNFITPEYAIGSANRFYLLHDKQISANLASAKKLPFIQFVPDVFDAPYGRVKITEKSGHLKPAHIRSTLAAVQHEGSLLALGDLSGFLSDGLIGSLGSNFVIPAEVDAIYVDAKKISVSVGMAITLPATSTVVLQEGNGMIAFKFFAADALGEAPSFAFKYDGDPWGAARFVAYHYRGKPLGATQAPIRIGFVMFAQECASDEDRRTFMKRCTDTEVTQSMREGKWSAETSAPDGTKLALTFDLPSRTIVSRFIDGKAVTGAVLSVNGRDLSSILSERTGSAK